MLTPIPGMVHLKVIVPVSPQDPEFSPSDGSPPPELPPRRSTAALIQLALEVACGMRPAESVDRKRFGPPARVHLAARARAGDLKGPVRVASLHLRNDGEVHGTAACADRWLAYTARVETTAPGRLLTFRVL